MQDLSDFDPDDDGDGDAAFAGDGSALLDSADGDDVVRRGEEAHAGKGEEEGYPSDFEAEGDESDASGGVEAADRLGASWVRLSRLEATALNLESWLEAKLRSDVDMEAGVGGAGGGVSGRAGAYLVGAELGSAGAGAGAGLEVRGDRTGAEAGADVRQSLSSAFFRRPSAAPHPDLAAAPTPPLTPNDETPRQGRPETLEAKRRQTAAVLSVMRDRLRTMGILQSTSDLGGAAGIDLEAGPGQEDDSVDTDPGRVRVRVRQEDDSVDTSPDPRTNSSPGAFEVPADTAPNPHPDPSPEPSPDLNPTLTPTPGHEGDLFFVSGSTTHTALDGRREVKVDGEDTEDDEEKGEEGEKEEKEEKEEEGEEGEEEEEGEE